jgi:GDP-fucose transporter C1
MSRQEYQRVPNEETIEMKESGSTSSTPHPPKGNDEPPPSRGMVIFSVLFYLVAAIVVSLC